MKKIIKIILSIVALLSICAVGIGAFFIPQDSLKKLFNKEQTPKDKQLLASSSNANEIESGSEPASKLRYDFLQKHITFYRENQKQLNLTKEKLDLLSKEAFEHSNETRIEPLLLKIGIIIDNLEKMNFQNYAFLQYWKTMFPIDYSFNSSSNYSYLATNNTLQKESITLLKLAKSSYKEIKESKENLINEINALTIQQETKDLLVSNLEIVVENMFYKTFENEDLLEWNSDNLNEILEIVNSVNLKSKLIWNRLNFIYWILKLENQIQIEANLNQKKMIYYREFLIEKLIAFEKLKTNANNQFLILLNNWKCLLDLVDYTQSDNLDIKDKILMQLNLIKVLSNRFESLKWIYHSSQKIPHQNSDLSKQINSLINSLHNGENNRATSITYIYKFNNVFEQWIRNFSLKTFSLIQGFYTFEELNLNSWIEPINTYQNNKVNNINQIIESLRTLIEQNPKVNLDNFFKKNLDFISSNINEEEINEIATVENPNMADNENIMKFKTKLKEIITNQNSESKRIINNFKDKKKFINKIGVLIHSNQEQTSDFNFVLFYEYLNLILKSGKDLEIKTAASQMLDIIEEFKAIVLKVSHFLVENSANNNEKVKILNNEKIKLIEKMKESERVLIDKGLLINKKPILGEFMLLNFEQNNTKYKEGSILNDSDFNNDNWSTLERMRNKVVLQFNQNQDKTKLMAELNNWLNVVKQLIERMHSVATVSSRVGPSGYNTSPMFVPDYKVTYTRNVAIVNELNKMIDDWIRKIQEKSFVYSINMT
ncbi:hypothetical protein VO56_01230 [Mycoplasmopsis gallinacea]|uniref:Uncharacterized protein n=1 Tax=Mycoplasmopsis gallinacea TaxID=29556 RepID=A0A0D5ZJN7_9BACT|nr:hypothetical protein VO56_01230 [Mycoplasmopsis gallinacea]